jgi:hypothetical protein
MIKQAIIAPWNQKLSRIIFGHSYFAKAGVQTGALWRFRDMNLAAQIGKDERWPGGLDISGVCLI